MFQVLARTVERSRCDPYTLERGFDFMILGYVMFQKLKLEMFENVFIRTWWMKNEKFVLKFTLLQVGIRALV